jgi:hypothetical protein
MTCGKFGRPFTATGEIRGKTVYLTGTELPQSGSGAQRPTGEPDLGSYNIEAAAGWCCPHCHTRSNTLLRGELLWQCRCRDYPGEFHCVGTDGAGGGYCACGKYEVRTMQYATSFAVRGEGGRINEA